MKLEKSLGVQADRPTLTVRPPVPGRAAAVVQRTHGTPSCGSAPGYRPRPCPTQPTGGPAHCHRQCRGHTTLFLVAPTQPKTLLDALDGPARGTFRNSLRRLGRL